MSPILLDTCALLWIVGSDPVSQEAIHELDDSWAARQPVFVSPISAWEIGLLARRGRMPIQMRPESWWSRVLQTSGLSLAQLPSEVLIASSLLPGAPPNDPADRILLATAREFGYRLMTRDGPLLDYSRAGHIQVIAC